MTALTTWSSTVSRVATTARTSEIKTLIIFTVTLRRPQQDGLKRKRRSRGKGVTARDSKSLLCTPTRIDLNEPQSLRISSRTRGFTSLRLRRSQLVRRETGETQSQKNFQIAKGTSIVGRVIEQENNHVEMRLPIKDRII